MGFGLVSELEYGISTFDSESFELEKFAFGDRTIPIHARTRGFSVPPQVMGMYESFELELNGSAWDTSGLSFGQIPSVVLEISFCPMYTMSGLP